MAVTTLSVPIHLKYILHIHAERHGAVTMAYDFGLERSWVRVLAATVWRCVLGQDTPPVCALSRPRSEWVPGWTVIACVFE